MQSLPPDILDQGRRRLRQLFEYLEAFEELRERPTRRLEDHPFTRALARLPDHPAIRFRFPVEAPAGETAGDDGRSETPPRPGEQPPEAGEPVLRVERVEPPPPPAPPADDLDWIEGRWMDPDARVRILEQRPDEAGGAPRRLDDDPERRSNLERWLGLRTEWIESSRPAREAAELFRCLYELHGRLQREGDELELVVGDGILSWRQPDGGIRYPLLTRRLELDLDAETRTITLHEADTPVVLETAVLHQVASTSGRVLQKITQLFEQTDVHPLWGGPTDDLLRQVVRHLAPDGELIEDEEPQGERDHPRIGRAPYLLLRRRTGGFRRAIRSILEDLETRQDLPESLLRVIGAPVAERDEPPASAPPREEILFGAPANAEQTEIARRLATSRSVVVQGPPGTGKTHTIANLIGHLLARGQRVLVTAHTTKALAVLRDQVLESLRPLAISVLGSDVASRRQLETAVEEMAERLGSLDPKRLEREAERLTTRRAELLGTLDELHGRLVQAREGELAPILVGGESFRPADAARTVAAGAARDGWLPGPVEPGAPLPLAVEEVLHLYGATARLSAEDETELRHPLPDPTELIAPDELTALIAERDDLSSREEPGTNLWASPPEPQELPALREVEEQLVREIGRLAQIAAEAPWQLPVLEDGCRGRAGGWCELTDRLDELARQAGTAEALRVALGTELPEGDPAEHLEIADALLAHLGAGKRLSGMATRLLHRRWSRWLDGAAVDGRRPERREEIEALREQARLELLRRTAAGRWDRQTERLELPRFEELGPDWPRRVEAYATDLRTAASWSEERWKPLIETLDGRGLLVETVSERLERAASRVAREVGPAPEIARRRRLLERLSDLVSARVRECRTFEIDQTRRTAARAAAAHADGTSRAPAVRDLLEALRTYDAAGYARAFERIERLQSLAPVARKRRELLERLRTTAPAWAPAVERREPPHDGVEPPGNPRRAWLWRQLDEELERRREVSLDEIQQRLDAQRLELARVTRKLIEHRVWARQLQRMTPELRQALFGWRDTVKKTPKTSSVPGKISRLQRAARQQMAACRPAVPVWIMPLHRLVESFDLGRDRFDVVIIDEASQTDLSGLAVAYAAERLLVVGDHEQVTPLAVGHQQAPIDRLIDVHLDGIPNAHLFDGKLSIYELAQHSSTLTTLREHFRSLPEIIAFSNDLCYGGRILPLRDRSSAPFDRPVVPFAVDGATMENKVNRREAEAIASLVLAATERPEYRDRTIGVVSLLGDQQALEIDRLLRQSLAPELYERHRIVCGNPAQFQGDERDVIFLSTVVAPKEGPHALYRQDQARQRFNVAASRGRDQLWVVYSVDPGRDLKPEDLRRRLIEHALDPGSLTRQLDRAAAESESELERRVAEHLLRAGFRIHHQWAVGHYRIDLVVEGGGKQLAVECDGDRYHTPENLRQDVERQATLERCGWTFVRVRGSHFFRRPDEAMVPVYERLRTLGIPQGADRVAPREPTPDASLHATVVRRAAEIRRDLWGDDTVADGDSAPSPEPETPPRAPERVPRTSAAASSVRPSPPRTGDERENERKTAEIAGPETPPPSGNGKSVHLPDPEPMHRLARPTGTDSPPAPGGNDSSSVLQALNAEELETLLLRHVPELERIGRDELFRQVAHQLELPWPRQEIRKRLNRSLSELVRAGRLETDWEDVWPFGL